MGSLWTRIIAQLRREHLDRELNEELEAHLAMQEEEFRQRGMNAAEARAAARREFGGVAQTAEAYRERRGLPWLETAAKDVRYALRGLARNPGFTAAAVLSLALGIGANTAIFSMFHTLMLRMLPVAHPEQLVTLYRTGPWGRGFSSYPLYLEVRKRSDLFSGVMGRSGPDDVPFRSGSSDRPETAQRELVTGNYFAVLGVPPAIGRLFTDGDNRTPHAHPLAVLSYDFWRSRFAADPAVLGRNIEVDKDLLTVIGVAARGFHGVDVDHRTDLWEPAMMYHGDSAQPGSFWIWIMARRRPDVSRQQVQAAVGVLFQQHLNSLYGTFSNAGFRKTALAQHIEVREGGVGVSLLRESFATALTVLMAAVVLVLLAACANVANLLLARGAARQRETAIRLSLGATRGRLVRLALAESLLLAGCGGLLGVGLAYFGERGVMGFLPASFGDPFSAGPDPTVLAFLVGTSLLSVVLFGLAPALRSTSVDPAESIKTGTGQAGSRRPLLRRALVVAQVAFSVMLVALAALFAHSLAALRSQDLGFRNQNLIAVSLETPTPWEPSLANALLERFQARMAALPGVSMVSFGCPGPFVGGYSSMSLRVPGSEATAKETAWVAVQRVAPRYFEILGSPLVTGREFDRHDTPGARKVALVNQAFVRAFLPGEPHPTDRVMNFDDAKYDPTYIVGVVRDIPHRGLREKVSPTVYLPVDQMPAGFGMVLLQSTRPLKALLPAIRRETAKLGPDITASEPRTIRQRIDESIFRDRMVATVGGFFGGLALLLAAIGLYGVMAYATARRAREIGIRIAMGARRTAVLWMVLRGALVLVAGGLAIGLPASLAASQNLVPLLFGIQPNDSLTYVTTTAVLLATGLAAAFIPARRAARMEPMQMLRQD
ncbi:MAG TPA: ABC transporter permease [Bryobacteraceae bacterium]|nr:ABC transporter permease [Bryobacteraceae bacterium]